jgi:transposase-like protein
MSQQQDKKLCPRCKSPEVVKSGKHKNQKGVTQRYQCKECGTSFSNDGYYRGKHNISLVQYAAVLYREGYSYEKIQIILKEEFGVPISRVTIGDWIKMLQVQPRRRSSGNQKEKIVRDLVEIGVMTTVKFADSFHPTKFYMLDNFSTLLLREKTTKNGE